MRKIQVALKNVPNSNTVTEGLWQYCSQYLQIDATYVSIRGRKYAFIWVVDYYHHDILYSILAPSESYQAYRSCFSHLKKMGIFPRVMTADEHSSIYRALKDVFPSAKLQLCHVHILRNIRKQLDTKSFADMQFLGAVKRILESRHIEQFRKRAVAIQHKYHHNELYRKILLDLNYKTEHITTFLRYRKTPNTTNLIECYNSHLKQRLRAIKGFQSYKSANLWLNAYVIRKRTKPLTDCGGQFKKLNGTIPLFHTAGDAGPVEKLVKYFGINFRV